MDRRVVDQVDTPIQDFEPLTPSVRAFLTGIVDYAGLFPPAKLALDPAIRNYARYRTEPEAWMLGRFICPAARLSELLPYHGELFLQGSPFAFSALGRGGETAAAFLAGLEADLEALAAFRRPQSERVAAEVLEVRLPRDLVESGDAAAVRELLNQATGRIEATMLPKLTPFYEAAFGPEWRRTVGALVQGIASHNADRWGMVSRCGPAGFKLRCGGVEAAAFPSTEQVAWTVAECAEVGVALKATAGLHHPVRRFDRAVGTTMHGFLNVFGAGVLAHALKLDEPRVRAIVEDESAESFAFDERAFAWKDLRVPLEQIEAARRSAVTSFGSCSFDEPREDLKALGLRLSEPRP